MHNNSREETSLKNSVVTKLKTPYVSVSGSYGGNQSWFREIEKKSKGKTIDQFGCGLVGASDLLLHVLGESILDGKYSAENKLNHESSKDKQTSSSKDMNIVSSEAYRDYILSMEKKYFHILPKLGISGVLLAWGLNIYFLINRKKIKEATGGRLVARWAVWPTKILDKIKEMLSNDIPIILAIGPGFFKKEKLKFYNKIEENGTVKFKHVTQTKDHYVTVTGVEEYLDQKTIDNNTSGKKTIDNKSSEKKPITMLEISSWGKKYYVNYDEYKKYVKKNDNYYFSNILYVKLRKKGQP